MAEMNYLQWLSEKTPTNWWHDSCDPDELKQGKANGAVGVTTNPILCYRALKAKPDYWLKAIQSLDNVDNPKERVEGLVKCVVQKAARMFEPIYESTDGEQGYVCCQVDPAKASDRKSMVAMAERFHGWASNVSVKLPATAAGLDALEDCAAKGISVTSTVSFSVTQVVAAAERYEAGIKRAENAGIERAHCFSVIMIGRIDDYIRDVAHDSKASVEESDIKQAGIAVVKRAYKIFNERDYRARLLIAAMRGTHHLVSLCGSEMTMSIHPKIQLILLRLNVPHDMGFDNHVPPDVIRRLKTIPEFIKAYELDGMQTEDFITYGVTQKTLSQFSEVGWKLLEGYDDHC